MAILPKEMQSFDYYKKLTPMYLAQLPSFMIHEKIFFDIGFQPESTLTCGQFTACGVDEDVRTSSIFSTAMRIFRSLDIFEVAYANYWTTNDVLDKLAALFGVSRHFTVINTVEGTDTEYELNLSNSDLILLIKCQVIKNFFDGSFEELDGYYKLVGLPVIALTDSNAVAKCNMYMLLLQENEVSENVKKMFLAGLLSVESIGIQYTYNIVLAPNIAIFDSVSTTAGFDAGQFIL